MSAISFLSSEHNKLCWVLGQAFIQCGAQPQNQSLVLSQDPTLELVLIPRLISTICGINHHNWRALFSLSQLSGGITRVYVTQRETHCVTTMRQLLPFPIQNRLQYHIPTGWYKHNGKHNPNLHWNGEAGGSKQAVQIRGSCAIRVSRPPDRTLDAA